MKKRAAAPRSTSKKKLPTALAKRAAAASADKNARLAARARGLLDLVDRRKGQISEAFYDIGEALRELSHPDMIETLGRKTFAQVCTVDCKISVTLAEGLIRVVSMMSRDQAISAGSQTKAIALAELAQATPDDDRSATLTGKKHFALPDGTSLDLSKASAQEVEHAAVVVRHARSSKSGRAQRGRTTSAEERKLAQLLQRRLHGLGLTHAKVTAVATKPGQGADLRFEHIPCAKVDVLKKAIGA